MSNYEGLFIKIKGKKILKWLSYSYGHGCSYLFSVGYFSKKDAFPLGTQNTNQCACLNWECC